MKILKTIALSLFITVSSISAVFAGPTEAINNVSAKITEASEAITKGSSNDDITLIIREATNLGKEIRVSDNIDVKRQRASAHLKKARLAVKKNKLDAAKEHLTKATEAFANLKKLL